MTDFIQTGDYQIHPVAGQVLHRGQSINVRPKTFELLLMLVEARGALVSKQELLAEIWTDVSVDEQVVFQSIKELRKVFGTIEAIKTVPRKGYAWTLPVETISKPQPSAAKTGLSTRRLAVTGSLVLLLFLVVMTLFRDTDEQRAKAGAVIVLPVVSTLTDADHRWVRYGAMDHLIHRLPATETVGVYQAGDVLDVVKRAGISGDGFTRPDIARIFSVTGAALVVETAIGGTPREYQLLYTIHDRNGIEKGALLADRIEAALDQLATKINQKIGQKDALSIDDYRSDFANEMIASALEQMQKEEFASAEKLLDAAVATEPNNIVAKRLLAQALVTQNLTDKAGAVLKVGLQQAQEAGNRAELLRLNYWAGVDRMQNGDWDGGLAYLSVAAQEADALRDWLYLGYIAEFRGHAQRAMGNLEHAEQQYRTAIDYHRVIQCPYGEAQGLLNIARVSLQRGNRDGAYATTQSALQIISERDLHSLSDEATRWMISLEGQSTDPAN